MPDEINPEEFNQAIELAEALLRESEAETIAWTEEAADEEAPERYWTNIANKIIEIASRDGDGRHPFVLTIRDSPNSVLLRLDTSMMGPISGAPSGWQQILEQLYVEARSRGRTLNKALNEIIGELDRKESSRGDIPF